MFLVAHGVAHISAPESFNPFNKAINSGKLWAPLPPAIILVNLFKIFNGRIRKTPVLYGEEAYAPRIFVKHLPNG